MNDKRIQIGSCSRREFVVSTGLFFAGAVVSCSHDDDVPSQDGVDETPTKTSELAIPNTTPVIRVRIGKIRKKSSTKIGDTQVTRSNNKWYTYGNTPTNKRNGGSITFESLKKCRILQGDNEKIISGTLDLCPRDDISTNAYDIVATIPIERYLPGVLAGELYAHWHPATFAAQAIAARSYAVAQHLRRRQTSHFDVSDDASSQMFLGDVSLDVAHRAVKETNGMIMSWAGTVVPAYYSACCGGVAATAIDEISSSKQHDIPPLLGHAGVDACTSLNIHKWSIRRDSRTLRKRLNACAASMPLSDFADIYSIRSIKPSATNKHGRPNKLAIVNRRRGVVEVRARDFLRAANTRFASLPQPVPIIWSSFLVGKRKGDQLQVDGVGMGHGVGLCQYGAQELAGRGKSFEDILSWYYPGADLHTIST